MRHIIFRVLDKFIFPIILILTILSIYFLVRKEKEYIDIICNIDDYKKDVLQVDSIYYFVGGRTGQKYSYRVISGRLESNNLKVNDSMNEDFNIIPGRKIKVWFRVDRGNYISVLPRKNLEKEIDTQIYINLFLKYLVYFGSLPLAGIIYTFSLKKYIRKRAAY